MISANTPHSEHPQKYRFTGHETFPFRYTWPPKGVEGVLEHPDLFANNEAMVILGVGKNMVSSIRHWCEALGLVENVDRGREFAATPLGMTIFGPTGRDSYMEAPGTLWLLHWQLTKDVENTSTWYLAFTRWTSLEFRKEHLLEWLWGLKEEAPGTRLSRSSLNRDVDVFLRTYIPAKVTATRPIEDTFDCPLVELGLIQEIEKGVYAFARGPKPSLPDHIFIYALLDYWRLTASDQASLSFEQILHGPGSPGGAFKLTENDLFDRLTHLPKWAKLQYDDTAGLRQVFRTGKKTLEPLQALHQYYEGLQL